jgi:hypothetical protein
MTNDNRCPLVSMGGPASHAWRCFRNQGRHLPASLNCSGAGALHFGHGRQWEEPATPLARVTVIVTGPGYRACSCLEFLDLSVMKNRGRSSSATAPNIQLIERSVATIASVVPRTGSTSTQRDSMLIRYGQVSASTASNWTLAHCSPPSRSMTAVTGDGVSLSGSRALTSSARDRGPAPRSSGCSSHQARSADHCRTIDFAPSPRCPQ